MLFHSCKIFHHEKLWKVYTFFYTEICIYNKIPNRELRTHIKDGQNTYEEMFKEMQIRTSYY